MITGELKNKIDGIWDIFWSSGMTNPLTVIEQITYLMFIKILDDNEVIWQMGELGKVDQGGGGTIAKFMANRNIDTIDAGVPVLSMHAPFEVVAKFDCYMTYKGVLAAYSDKE